MRWSATVTQYRVDNPEGLLGVDLFLILAYSVDNTTCMSSLNIGLWKNCYESLLFGPT